MSSCGIGAFAKRSEIRKSKCVMWSVGTIRLVPRLILLLLQYIFLILELEMSRLANIRRFSLKALRSNQECLQATWNVPMNLGNRTGETTIPFRTRWISTQSTDLPFMSSDKKTCFRKYAFLNACFFKKNILHMERNWSHWSRKVSEIPIRAGRSSGKWDRFSKKPFLWNFIQRNCQSHWFPYP